MGYLQNYIKKDNEEKMNKYERKAKKINPNLKLITRYLDKDWAGFKKGEIFGIYDTVTGRQTHLNFHTANEAWKYISESHEAVYLSKP